MIWPSPSSENDAQAPFDKVEFALRGFRFMLRLFLEGVDDM